MNELNEIWEAMLEKAIEDARNSGRSDLADYLQLKASNDAIRSESSKWLFGSFLSIAHKFIERGLNIIIENENPHRFQMLNASMAGALLRFRHGLRCLTIESGWTRTPGDGFMRMNSLAAAKISHFGMPKRNSEMILAKKDGMPNWFLIENEAQGKIITLDHLRETFDIFLN